MTVVKTFGLTRTAFLSTFNGYFLSTETVIARAFPDALTIF
jgi:hypothetical protein